MGEKNLKLDLNIKERKLWPRPQAGGLQGTYSSYPYETMSYHSTQPQNKSENRGTIRDLNTLNDVNELSAEEQAYQTGHSRLSHSLMRSQGTVESQSLLINPNRSRIISCARSEGRHQINESIIEEEEMAHQVPSTSIAQASDIQNHPWIKYAPINSLYDANIQSSTV